MRKTLLLLFLLPYLVVAQENESYLIKAKVKQGSILLGGTVDASFYKTTDAISSPGQTINATEIMATINAKNGYFVMHDFVIGLNLTIDFRSKKIDTTEEMLPDKRTYMLMGPFVRYYLDNGIFGEFSVAPGLLNFSKSDKFNLLEGRIGIGYAYFFNEKFSIEPMLSVRYFQQKLGDRKYTAIGPVLGVGIQAYLLRKKAHVIKRAL
ncbi:hypothetical protein ABID22_001520 [Pontibacter aydingkolensis]|uniref:Outer membrane protein beta-barrel domain-containing protein n=1 Tax=Pontibacter aydingkolensis TaxID=1911536 RepID=A0ABS7CTL6_9BACT|nr:hypothetical protein [Pontibacter aydingkolensis]MBW7467194.1 hypothetical protein [Pontibacter aydingkolensis]